MVSVGPEIVECRKAVPNKDSPFDWILMMEHVSLRLFTRKAPDAACTALGCGAVEDHVSLSAMALQLDNDTGRCSRLLPMKRPASSATQCDPACRFEAAAVGDLEPLRKCTAGVV